MKHKQKKKILWTELNAFTARKLVLLVNVLLNLHMFKITQTQWRFYFTWTTLHHGGKYGEII